MFLRASFIASLAIVVAQVNGADDSWILHGLLLIDPQGRLVAGDERTLAEKLGGATRTDPKP